MKRVSAGAGRGFRDYSGTMTDISFLLIVFFLIAAVFVSDRGLFLALPDPDAGPRELSPDEAVVVGVKASSFAVDGASVSESDLLNTLTAAISAKRPEAVILEPEPGVPYSRVLATLETAKASGGVTFSIVAGKAPLPVELKE